MNSHQIAQKKLDKITIGTKLGAGKFFPFIKVRAGRQTFSWTLETSFSSQTDALDFGFAWARNANWCRPVVIEPPYTRAAWAGPWPELRT
jgi:hypothetical protein